MFFEFISTTGGQTKSATTASAGQISRREADELATENKLLRKQRATLLAAVRKQQRLVELVRQQRLHLEAAKVLAFSEEEFIRTLEWGSEL